MDQELLNLVQYFVPEDARGVLPCVECRQQTANSLQVGILWLRPLCPNHDLLSIVEKQMQEYTLRCQYRQG